MAFQSGHVGLKAQPKGALVDPYIARSVRMLLFEIRVTPGVAETWFHTSIETAQEQQMHV
jgi:hypothetical protein